MKFDVLLLIICLYESKQISFYLFAIMDPGFYRTCYFRRCSHCWDRWLIWQFIQ